MKTLSKNNILFFDEDCILCNKSIRFIHILDIHKRIYFSSLQTQLGEEIQKEIQIKQSLSTVIYYKKGKIYSKSSAIFHCLSDIHWFLKPLKLFLLIPKVIRNGLYDFIASNRKLLFKNQTCKLPSKSLKKQVLYF